MARPEPDFGLEELYAELTTLPEGVEDAVSVTEICEETGLGTEIVRGRLKQLIKQGKVEATRKYIIAIDGRRMPVSAYRAVRRESGDPD